MANTKLFRRLDLWGPLSNAVKAMPHPRAGGPTHLRVFSGGCATGREPYSIAMLLEHYCYRHDFTVTATDVDPDLIAQARTGVLTDGEVARALLREGILTRDMAERYLTRVDTATWQVKPRVLDRIDFTVADLNAPAGLIPDPCHLAFCANMWRHLNPDGRHALAAELGATMPDYGLLVIGPSDLYFGEDPNDPTGPLLHRPEFTVDMQERFRPHPRHPLMYRPRTDRERPAA
ncbi:CheR family methyltransferase [Georgenia sp. M64]|uniref:CheR family methyltransferase n=1 Tax=Georgenia sp. M64 TaxID=3120520 RepID=UPI0030DE9266